MLNVENLITTVVQYYATDESKFRTVSGVTIMQVLRVMHQPVIRELQTTIIQYCTTISSETTPK